MRLFKIDKSKSRQAQGRIYMAICIPFPEEREHLWVKSAGTDLNRRAFTETKILR